MLTIGIQGGQGSYHELAAKLLRPDDTIVYYPTFPALFRALITEEVDRILCAVANSQIGIIPEVSSELTKMQGKYAISKEIALPIHHCLLGVAGAVSSDITHIHSQKPALDQCAEFLLQNYPNATLVEETDTALSAQKVAYKKDKAHAAIASEIAGKIYGLPILRTNIQDDTKNITNFLELKRK